MERKRNVQAGFWRQAVLLAVSLGAGLALSLWPEEAAAGAAGGIEVCLSVLVPSLFPFMVLGVFLVRSGAAALLGRVLERPARFLFRLPGACAPVILMGMVGGYPVGARGIMALLAAGEISEEEARRMLCFCVNAGPAFVLSAVGAGFLHSPQAGGILLAAQLSSGLLLGVLCRWGGKPSLPARRPARKPAPSAGEALVLSVSDACRSMVIMCCFVVLFAVLLSFAGLFLPQGWALTLLSALLEVTGGCRDLAAAGAPLWMAAAALGWGGLCVQLQIFSSLGRLRLSFLRFALFRLLHGVLAALAAFLLCLAFPPPAQEVFANTAEPLAPALASTPWAAAALLLSCAVFLLSARRPSQGFACKRKKI